jgi:HSP20 family molecular chaperone IbpA
MTEEKKDLQLQETEKQEVQESGAERTRERPAFIADGWRRVLLSHRPRSDIYELNSEIVADGYIRVVADMPDVDADSVEITLERNTLTINGYIKPMDLAGYTPAYAEYRETDVLIRGDYQPGCTHQRSFSLSNEIDQSKIEAEMKDGVLHLHLPKVGLTTRKIAVRS